jgi:hypothetical protein
MKIIHINPSNYNKSIEKHSQNQKIKKHNQTKHSRKSTSVNELNNAIKNGNHVFLLIYMEGCGPCNATRPEWEKVKNVLKEKYKNKYIHLPLNPAGFPTMVYISQKGKNIQNYEDLKKDRKVDSFVEWILQNTKQMRGGFNYKTKKQTKRTTTIRRPM